MSKQTVAVLVSGGVDSSVACALLKPKYRVIAIFAKTWSTSLEEFGVSRDHACPWIEDEWFARRVANQLNIPFYSFSVEKEYKKAVISYFFRQYELGNTPNPDVVCNSQIKFKILLEKARHLGADMLATGHYVRVAKLNKKKVLLKGADNNKDQSYFLWQIKRSVLKKLLLPIGALRKRQVREIAKQANLPTASRPDSQGICFLGPVKLRDFLKTAIKPRRGEVVLENNQKIGYHEGVWFYTIGQRIGVDFQTPLKINFYDKHSRPPLFVLKKDLSSNRLIVGPANSPSLFSRRVVASNLNWLVENPKDYFDKKLFAQIRYRQQSLPAKISQQGKKIITWFSEPVRAVTAGQSIVWYDKTTLLGGGIIN